MHLYKIVIVHNVFTLEINENCIKFLFSNLRPVSGCNAKMIKQTFKIYIFNVSSNLLMGKTGNYAVLSIYNN